MNHSEKTRKLATLAILSALAFCAVAVCRIPITPVEFLKYEPKDVVIAIAGFIFGPLSAVAVSVVVSVVEMVTISATGLWGLLMNVISTASFAGCAAAVYRKHRTLAGAVVGLALGTVLSTGMMLLWNWLVTPIYMGYPREAVEAMLLPIFLPFNLIKCVLNASLTMFFYRAISTSLRRSGLIPKSGGQEKRSRTTLLVAVFSLLAVITAVIVILAWNGKI